jgi:hypothetical protein
VNTIVGVETNDWEVRMMTLPTKDILDVSLIAKWISKRSSNWQIRFLSLDDLCRCARDRGLSFWCLDGDIKWLWQIGVLRADFVIAESPLEDVGLSVVDEIDGYYIHSDERACIQRAEGLGGIVTSLGEMPAGATLMFHPFRYYVLRKIEQELELRTAITQKLRFPQGYFDVIQHEIDGFRVRSSGDVFQTNVRHWNEVVSLAVAAEPFTFNKLFGVYTVPYEFAFNGKEREFRAIMESQFLDYGEVVRAVGIERLKEIIAELNHEARLLEPNAEILKILRFTKRKYRLDRVKGSLGGAVYLLTMAEIIRRSTEMVFKIELPEEHDSEGFNKFFFGADRLTDDYTARGEFLRTLGLDHSIRLRWYVEGDTELGALEKEIAHDRNIELINLRGDVAAAKGKGLSFRENLLADMNRSVYSWVSLDGDCENNKKVLLKAVKDGQTFGSFFISNPDFEFGNFTRDELISVLWHVALERGANLNEEETLSKACSQTTSGEELFKTARKAVPALQGFSKGKAWGARLMVFAGSNHKIKQGDGTLRTRPIIEAIYLARHDADCNYFLARKECEVDIDTGRLKRKPKQERN